MADEQPTKAALFADCRDGNHSECLVSWPEIDIQAVPPEQTGVRLVCDCPCHTLKRRVNDR